MALRRDWFPVLRTTSPAYLRTDAAERHARGMDEESDGPHGCSNERTPRIDTVRRVVNRQWNALCKPVRPEGTCMIGVLGWIVFGLIVGIIAKLLMPGK